MKKILYVLLLFIFNCSCNSDYKPKYYSKEQFNDIFIDLDSCYIGVLDNQNTDSLAPIFNEFIEIKNPNTYSFAIDFKTNINNQFSFLSDRNIPKENIKYYYGIVDGKIKFDLLENFNDSDKVVIVRNSLNINKSIIWQDNIPYYFDSKNNMISMINEVEYNKYLLYSPSLKKCYFCGSYALFNESIKKLIKQITLNIHDLIPIILDSGVYYFSYPFDNKKTRIEYLEEGGYITDNAVVFGIK